MSKKTKAIRNVDESVWDTFSLKARELGMSHATFLKRLIKKMPMRDEDNDLFSFSPITSFGFEKISITPKQYSSFLQYILWSSSYLGPIKKYYQGKYAKELFECVKKTIPFFRKDNLETCILTLNAIPFLEGIESYEELDIINNNRLRTQEIEEIVSLDYVSGGVIYQLWKYLNVVSHCYMPDDFYAIFDYNKIAPFALGCSGSAANPKFPLLIRNQPRTDSHSFIFDTMNGELLKTTGDIRWTLSSNNFKISGDFRLLMSFHHLFNIIKTKEAALYGEGAASLILKKGEKNHQLTASNLSLFLTDKDISKIELFIDSVLEKIGKTDIATLNSIWGEV